MPKEIWFPGTSQQIVHALRFGGFASFIPCVIGQSWNDLGAPLAGFPISICFIDLPKNEKRDDGSYFVSCYWFDPGSYDESEECQSMSYRSRFESQYQVVLDYSKKDRKWKGRKLRHGEVVIAASGHDLTRFVIELTMRGINNGEAVERMLTRVDTASNGIWVYEPQLAHVGKLQ
jgi:hypothetical protein